MRKYFFYEDYKKAATDGFEWLVDMGDSDLYFNADERIARRVYKESVMFWQSDELNMKEWLLFKKEVKWLLDFVDEIKKKEDEDIDTTDDIFYLKEQLHF